MPVEDAEPKEDGSPMLYQLGHDSKYGRVFVEIPPAGLAALLAEDKIDEAAQRYGNEPLFILRGVDVCTPDTIDAWMEENVERENPNWTPAMAEAVQGRAEEILDWQTTNPDLVKLAD